MIPRNGVRRIETWLKNRKVKGAATLAQAAVEAAQAQHTDATGIPLAATLAGGNRNDVIQLLSPYADSIGTQRFITR